MSLNEEGSQSPRGSGSDRGSGQRESRESYTTFGSVMIHDFKSVEKQARSGIASIEVMRDIITKFADAEKAHAKRLHKLTKDANKAVERVCRDDTLWEGKEIWDKLETFIIDISNQHTRRARRLEEECVNRMMTFEKASAATLKNVTDLVKNKERDFKKAKQEMYKSEHDARHNLQSLEEAEKREEKEEGEVRTRKTSRTSPLTKLSLLGMRGKKSASVYRDKAVSFATDNQRHVKQVNAAQRDLMFVHMPACLDSIQELERVRLETIKENMLGINNIYSETLQQFEEIEKKFSEPINAVNPEELIEQFIIRWGADKGPPPQLDAFEYTLPPPKDIQDGLAKQHGVYFFSTLEVVMAADIQSKRTNIGVPVLLSEITSKIREWGGVSEEGIFRLSVGKGVLDSLTAQFRKGDFSFELANKDPHVCACLLKVWLRSLKEPILEMASYEEMIALCERKQSGEVRGDEMEEKVMKIFEGMGVLRKDVVMHIAKLCVEIVEEHETNLMSYKALSVVFAPCLMRPPNVEQLSPLELLGNSQHETEFVFHLLQALAKKL